MQKQENVFTLTELEERVEFGLCGGGSGGGDGGGGNPGGGGCSGVGDVCDQE